MKTEKRFVYLNGRMVPEDEAVVSIFDQGFLYGACFFEALRTFKHRYFQADEHWRRLKRSLTYAGLPDLIDRKKYDAVLEQVLAANIHLTDKGDDICVWIQVTPGKTSPLMVSGQVESKPVIIAYTSALPHTEDARCYAEGKHVYTSLFRTPPPQALEQRMKCRSRFTHFISKQYAERLDKKSYALMLDIDGFIAEGPTNNIFFVLDGVLYTPRTRNALGGISRQYVIELAGRLDLKVVEDDLTLYEAYNAEEAFWSATTYCILPISMIDGRLIGATYPGKVTAKLLKAWSKAVGVDIIGQARKFSNL
jgi:branched-subunit amino acid aminotransferase/4-amino-4-deoxychorismate lyase